MLLNYKVRQFIKNQVDKEFDYEVRNKQKLYHNAIVCVEQQFAAYTKLKTVNEKVGFIKDIVFRVCHCGLKPEITYKDITRMQMQINESKKLLKKIKKILG